MIERLVLSYPLLIRVLAFCSSNFLTWGGGGGGGGVVSVR